MNRPLLAAVVLSAFLACPPPSSPPSNTPPPADHRLEVYQATNLAWSDDLTQVTFPSWAFGAEGMGPTPFLSLAPSTSMKVRYSLTGADAQTNPAQLLALARDPIELRDALDAVPAGDLVTFDDLVAPCALPDGVLMQADFDVFASTPVARTERKLSTADFFNGCPAPKPLTGPASLPLGVGSLKTLETFRAGLCATSVPLDQVMEPVLSGLDDAFRSRLAATGCVSATGRSRAVSLVTHQAARHDPDPFPSGAFVVQYRFDAHIYAPLPDPHGAFNARFQFDLVGGRPGVVGNLNSVSSSGHQSSDISAAMTTAVTQTIPDAVRQSFDQQLAAAPLLPNTSASSFCTTDADCSGSLVCAPSEAVAGQRTCHALAFGFCTPEMGAEGRPTEQVSVGGDCQTAVGMMKDAITRGGLARNLTQPQVDAAYATFGASSGGKLTHWRCRRPEATAKGRCEYVIDVKRMNVKPGQLDLVFFDEPDEVTQSAFPLYLLLVDMKKEEQLCRGVSDTGERHVRESRGFDLTADYTDAVSCAVNNLSTIF